MLIAAITLLMWPVAIVASLVGGIAIAWRIVGRRDPALPPATARQRRRAERRNRADLRRVLRGTRLFPHRTRSKPAALEDAPPTSPTRSVRDL